MIIVDLEKCSGCRRCEVHCSFFHSGRVGRNGSRIKVVKIEELGMDFPVVCRQCRERYCTKCPESAIRIGPYGQVSISPKLCTACGTCQKFCPIGAIELFNDIPHVCDLCGGDPHCVKACTMGAISFDPDTVEHVSLKVFKKGSLKLSPEQKRIHFALSIFKPLREKWVSARRA